MRFGVWEWRTHHGRGGRKGVPCIPGREEEGGGKDSGERFNRARFSFCYSFRAGGCNGEVPSGQSRQGGLPPSRVVGALKTRGRPPSGGKTELRSAVGCAGRGDDSRTPSPEPEAWDRVGGDGGGPQPGRRERPRSSGTGGGSGPRAAAARAQQAQSRLSLEGCVSPTPHSARPPPPPPLLSPAHDPPFCSIHAPLRHPPPKRAPRPGRRRCRRRRRCACALGARRYAGGVGLPGCAGPGGRPVVGECAAPPGRRKGAGNVSGRSRRGRG